MTFLGVSHYNFNLCFILKNIVAVLFTLGVPSSLPVIDQHLVDPVQE